MVTVIAALWLSQLSGVRWLTYHVVLPIVLVLGVGAVVLPVPPDAIVYQYKVLPEPAVAVSGEAVAPWQYAIAEFTIGAFGVGFTTTAIKARGPSQPFPVDT